MLDKIDLNFFKDKKILILGSSGFLGKSFINKYNSLLNQNNLLTVSRNDKNSTFNGSIENKTFIEELIKATNPYAIVNLTAFKDRGYSIDNFYSSIQTNIIGSLNIYNAVINNKSTKLIVNIGTCEEYGQNSIPFLESQCELPISPYSWSKTSTKLMSNIISNFENFNILTLRPSIAYGPLQDLDMFLPSLINNLLLKKEFDMTSGNQTRDFIYIDDIVNAILLALYNNKFENNSVFNIASGYSIKIKILAEKVEEIIGNYGLIKFGLKNDRKNEIIKYDVNINKAVELLNWHPITPLEDGLAKTIAYYKSLLQLERKI
ncbi:NAD-dependent epimerase/dehydratase family protein [Silvanigrella sp.]|jgi:UDP-glucose 4-epimerase|uniref:NAD-dependent epimerase/dehydratase family protein n=1 Tax=Silvanigrella sp. TaxID=2024976 RepID=UPI0037C6FCFD|nr:NAD(P)-dependent oxidoreductase [Silvanigrellaceae bacterium]